MIVRTIVSIPVSILVIALFSYRDVSIGKLEFFSIYFCITLFEGETGKGDVDALISVLRWFLVFWFYCE